MNLEEKRVSRSGTLSSCRLYISSFPNRNINTTFKCIVSCAISVVTIMM